MDKPDKAMNEIMRREKKTICAIRMERYQYRFIPRE